MAVTELCVRLIDPTLDPELPAWGDCGGAWQPDALEWLGTLVAAGVPVRCGTDASVDDGRGLLIVSAPDVTEFRTAPGRPVLIGEPPPSPEERLAAIRDALGALVAPDMRGVMALRLDDPGAATKVHLRGWAHPPVAPESWRSMFDALGGTGRMSVFCCPGWVQVDGQVVDSRQASPDEWGFLDEGANRGCLDLECHGFTHQDPDRSAWLSAPDRHSNPDWYRELWSPRLAEEPPVEAQRAILRSWQRSCGQGTAVVAPGEAWGERSLVAAQLQGFSLFNSWGLCRLDLQVPTWTRGVGSPYLDQPDGAWANSQLPVIGYWHDRDMALEGPGWVPHQLARWRDCGIARFVAFADLAGAYRTGVDAALVDGEVVVRHAPTDWPLRIELAR